MTKVARLLRDEDRLVSSAHVIEAVRLADTLAAMRGRPLAGLTETTDAIRAVMCEGSDVPLSLVHDKLVVGDVLGEVPDAAPGGAAAAGPHAAPAQAAAQTGGAGAGVGARSAQGDGRGAQQAAPPPSAARDRLGRAGRVPGEHGDVP